MGEIKITKKLVDEQPFSQSGQRFIWDSDLHGFGLCIGKKSKSYVVQKLVNNKPKRVTIGKHGVWSPETARKKAHALLAEMANGIDPNQEKARNRVKGLTILDLHKAYVRDAERRLAAGSLANYQDFMDNHFSGWHGKPAADITKEMVVKRHQEIAAKAGRSNRTCHATANSAMQYLRALFNYAQVDNEGLANPVAVLSQKKLWYTVKRRQTHINDEQLSRWHAAVLNLQNQTIKDALRVLLLTGLRKMEAFQLRWENVDLHKQTILVPITKNGTPHKLPMSDILYEILKNRKASAGDSPWVFPGDGKAGHITTPTKAIEVVTKQTGIKFTPHDLRRTFATIAARLDIPAYALKRLLNHQGGGDVTAGYIVTDYQSLAGPMQKIADEIKRLIALKD